MSIDDQLMGELLKSFATEAGEWSQSVTRGILEAERATDGSKLAPLYEDLARTLHNLKGTAATVGRNDLAELAHAMEEALLRQRAAGGSLPSPVADAILAGLDAFMARLNALREGNEDLPSIEAALLMLSVLSQVTSRTESRSETRNHRDVGSPALERSGGEQPTDGAWRVEAKQVIALMREVERLREIRLRLEERGRQINRGLAALVELEARTTTSEAAQIFSRLRGALASDSDETGDVVQLLEEGLKAICTMPVQTIMEPLRRVVRDHCRDSGKRAKLSVIGAEVALDRRVLEVLKRPLVHLVRNALDHGIEPPSQRELQGKHGEGALVIRVELQGNLVFVEVADDGRGFDTVRIREVANARGIASTAELAAMDDAQVYKLVFAPGFSTSREVTHTSGRGVGLDVVKSEIEALGGNVAVQSVRGQGARFLLTIPVELGSSGVLVVRCGEHELSVPALSVEAIAAADLSTLRHDDRQMWLVYRDELLSLYDVGALLGLRASALPQRGQPMLIIHNQGQRAAFIVDDVLGDWDLVIRPLPSEVRDIPAFQGAVMTATGAISLVLRTDWLVASTQGRVTDLAAQQRALVIDDSLTVRALHRGMLEAAGFVVHTTGSGRDGLEKVRGGSYDVVICDIQMAEMNGYEVASTLRSQRQTRSTPIILVSTHDSDEARARALEAGATAFLSKRECESGRLLAAVSSAIAARGASA